MFSNYLDTIPRLIKQAFDFLSRHFWSGGPRFAVWTIPPSTIPFRITADSSRTKMYMKDYRELEYLAAECRLDLDSALQI